MPIATFAAMAAAGGAAAVWMYSRFGPGLSVLVASGPALGLAVSVATAAFRSRTTLLADRLEVGVHWRGLRLWYRCVPWASVTGWERQNWGRQKFRVLRWEPSGVTWVMCGDDGVRLLVSTGSDIVIGSRDPSTLSAAIRAVRSGLGSARPVPGNSGVRYGR